jgi:hypothetical protein
MSEMPPFKVPAFLNPVILPLIIFTRVDGNAPGSC